MAELLIEAGIFGVRVDGSHVIEAPRSAGVVGQARAAGAGHVGILLDLYHLARGSPTVVV